MNIWKFWEWYDKLEFPYRLGGMLLMYLIPVWIFGTRFGMLIFALIGLYRIAFAIHITMTRR